MTGTTGEAGGICVTVRWIAWTEPTATTTAAEAQTDAICATEPTDGTDDRRDYNDRRRGGRDPYEDDERD